MPRHGRGHVGLELFVVAPVRRVTVQGSGPLPRFELFQGDVVPVSWSVVESTSQSSCWRATSGPLQHSLRSIELTVFAAEPVLLDFIELVADTQKSR